MTAFTKFHDLPIMRDSVKRSALHTSLQTDYIVLTSHVPPTEEGKQVHFLFLGANENPQLPVFPGREAVSSL